MSSSERRLRAYEVGIAEGDFRELRERNNINGKTKEFDGAIYNLHFSRNIVREINSRTKWTELATSLRILNMHTKTLQQSAKRGHMDADTNTNTHTHTYGSFTLRWILK
jgi:hypothetical protein